MDNGSLGRASGFRQVRRWSNWTAAALIGATALTTGYFARATIAAAPAAAIPGIGGTAGQLGASGVPGTPQPCVYVPVAVSGGSAVRAQPQQVLSCPPGSRSPAMLGPAQVGAGQGGWDHEGHDS
jgi:hypothetical protein